MTETGTEIRAGVIGFGLAGKVFHTAVIEATPGLELATIVQRKGDEAQQAYPDVKIARSIEEMLADPSLQLTVVATPSAAHFEHAEQCLKAGKHVVIDKPFTLTSDEARKLIELARERKLLLTAYQSRRWDGDFLTLKQVLASGKLGRIVTFENRLDRFRVEARREKWRENGGPGGGVLFDLGSHLVDQATALFGDPESIFADVRVDRESAVIDDAFTIQLKFRSGVTAICYSTLSANWPGARFVVHGTKGSFVQWGLDPQEDQAKAGKTYGDAGFGLNPEKCWGELYPAGQPAEKIVTVAGDYRLLYANVRDALLGVAELEVKPEQALRTTRLLELARESSREGSRLDYEPL